MPLFFLAIFLLIIKGESHYNIVFFVLLSKFGISIDIIYPFIRCFYLLTNGYFLKN